jgi:hypothetical protein
MTGVYCQFPQPQWTWVLVQFWAIKTLAACGLEEHMQITLICENHQFHVIYCVTLAYVLYFE